MDDRSRRSTRIAMRTEKLAEVLANVAEVAQVLKDVSEDLASSAIALRVELLEVDDDGEKRTAEVSIEVSDPGWPPMPGPAPPRPDRGFE